MKNKNLILARDIFIIVLSIAVAIYLHKAGILKNLIQATEHIGIMGTFVVGIFFTSIFTIALATAALVEFVQIYPLLPVALIGAIGAVLGDLIIFRFIRGSISEDIQYILEKTHLEKLSIIFHKKLFHWIIPFTGALVIISPLPDELGLLMMGLSNIRTSRFIPLSYVLNFLGILSIGIVVSLL